jgi:hypothetical protein
MNIKSIARKISFLGVLVFSFLVSFTVFASRTNASTGDKKDGILIQNLSDVFIINISGQTFEVKLWLIFLIVAALILLLIATILTKKNKQGQIKTKITNIH